MGDADRQAKGMTLHKAMLMNVDECLIALREAYADLTDDEFWQFAVEGHNNAATIVMHCLQQHDDFNANLQKHRGIPWKHGCRLLEPEERFELWGVPKEKLPKPGDDFPTVQEVLAIHDEIHGAVIANMEAMTEDEFTSGPVGPWPRLCDPFFRATYHTNAHIRQLWILRGVMGIDRRWPEQHFA